jgi:arabinogalactan endo-1,4-beta-galactosidase
LTIFGEEKVKITRRRKGMTFASTLCMVALSVCTLQDAKGQFANGADIGWLSEMEAQGYVFKDNSGVPRNCLDILKSKGVNALRFRVWVNPRGGYCNKKDVAYMAHRADSAGFRVMIDFHCSDTWADPGHQAKPAAWANDAFPQLLEDLHNHVYDVLDTLKSIGVVPAWVQIGNETNDGMLWPDGRATTHMKNFAQLIDTGYSAVKAVDSSIQVIVHLSNGHDDATFRWMSDGLKNNGARWDIIGMSVYPYWANLPWAADDSLALITMNDMIARYHTKVMVVETGYLYYQAVTANQFLLDLIAKTKLVGGLGVFYWEPESYNWQGYQLGAWDPTTKAPTVALDAFVGINATAVEQENTPWDYGLNIYPNPFNPGTTIELSVPRRSTVILTVFDLLGRNVRTLVNEIKDPGNFTIPWYGKSESGVPAASGTYVIRLNVGNETKIQKALMLK